MQTRFKQIIFLLLIPVAIVPADHSKINWVDALITTSATDRITVNDEGSPYDEDTGKIISISEAKNQSYLRAREKAVEKAYGIINSIPVNGTETIKNIIEKDPVARGRIVRIIHEYSTFGDKPSGYMECSCELKIKAGYLITALNYDFPCENFPLSDNSTASTKYTSLIIDVRGLGITPMLIPSIYNESGLEIYGRNFISGDDAVKNFPVSYTYTEDEAKKHKKAGKHPFFCIALKNLNGSPVLSDDDIKRIFSHKKNIAYLKKCRVIFIIDR